MKTKLLIVTLFISLASQASFEVKTVPLSGKVEFEAIGRPSMIKIKGAGEGATSNLQLNQNKISGVIIFNLNSLKTGIELRDAHMKEKYLQLSNNPLAKLTLSDLQLPANWSLQKPLLVRTGFRAKLNLHGVERDITGTYAIESDQLRSNAQFEIKLSDFNIDIPTYMGVKVADIVKINVIFDKMNLTKKN